MLFSFCLYLRPKIRNRKSTPAPFTRAHRRHPGDTALWAAVPGKAQPEAGGLSTDHAQTSQQTPAACAVRAGPSALRARGPTGSSRSRGRCRAPRASLRGDGDPGHWCRGPPWDGHVGGHPLAPLCRQALQALRVEAVEVEPAGQGQAGVPPVGTPGCGGALPGAGARGDPVLPHG